MTSQIRHLFQSIEEVSTRIISLSSDLLLLAVSCDLCQYFYTGIIFLIVAFVLFEHFYYAFFEKLRNPTDHTLT